MALVLANRVQETATPNTTVSFTLTGAVVGFQSFAIIGNGNTTYYSATDSSGNWEVGVGLYLATGTILVRNTISESSNSGSAVTFSGVVNVFVTLPSGSAVYEDASGNVSALGTVSSGTWQGSTIGVAYGGTGVTTSSGANSVVLRDANENITVNRINQGLQTITASGGTTTLTAASDFNQQLVGTGGHTFRLPDATTLTDTTTFQFNNNASGTLTIQNNAATTVGSVAAGGAAGIALMSNATVGGTWDVHGYIPENITWGTNSLYLASDVITGGIWNGGTIQSGYGGTGLTTFAGANNALYSTSASALAAGTLPVAAGGTGNTSGQAATVANAATFNNSGSGAASGSTYNGGSALTVSYNTVGAPSTGGANATGTWGINISGNAATATTAANVNNGTLTLAVSGTGLSGSASFTANQSGNSTFTVTSNATNANTGSTIVARDASGNFSAGTITATLSGSATSAGSVTNSVTFNNGGSGSASGITFNGSTARTISYNTIGAPSTGGTNATGTWGISITGNAGTATTATNVSGGTVSSTRVNPRSVASPFGSGSLTINGDTTDVYTVSLSGAITFLTPSGTPVNGQRLVIRVKDSGAALGITWTTSSGAFRAVGVTLPTTTVAGKVTYIGCIYNSADVFWDAVAVATQV